MASRYEISTIFRMVDNFSDPMKKIEGRSSALAKTVSASMRKTEMQIQAAGRALKDTAGLAVSAGFDLAGKTVVDSVKTYIEFEDAITKAGSKFTDLDVTASDYKDNLELLQKSAREVGAATMFSATDAAGALSAMAMAGLTSKQSMAMLMGTTNLAVAAGIDLTSAVDMATDAMGAFNLTSNDADQLTTNMNRIADVVAKTTNMANLDMSMWFETVKMGAPTFTSLGGEIEEFSALAGTLANAGIKGSQAGNELKNMMLNLSAPAKSGAGALAELGIQVFDSRGKMLPILDIMKQFERNLAGMADEKKTSLLKDIFGKEQIGAFNILLASGTDNLRNFTNELKNAGGSAGNIAGAQMQSFSGMIEQLKSAMQDKQLSLGKAFEVGGAKEALAGLITYMQTFDIAPIAAALTQMMQAIPAIVEGFMGFVNTLWGMKDLIGALVISWGLYKAAIIAALVVEKMQAFFAAIQAVQAATQGMTTAQAALNVVMSASPIELIIVAVGLLAFGIYELIKHWDAVSAAMSVAWEWVKNIAAIIWDNLIVAFEKVKEVFFIVKDALITGLRMIGVAIFDTVILSLKTVLELMANIPGIGGKATAGLDMLAGVRSGIMGTNTTPATAPVTQGERTAYSMSESVTEDHITVDVALDKGLKGSVSGVAPNTSLNVIRSGAFK